MGQLVDFIKNIGPGLRIGLLKLNLMQNSETMRLHQHDDKLKSKNSAWPLID